jgi:methionine sulfoxide reductase heme-binding subunit
LKPIVLLKRAVFVLALVPAALLVYDAFTGNLTANPVDYIEDQTGDWTIAFLMISLGVTPLRRLTGWNDIIKLRRMLGLFAFFYASLHLLTWIALVSFFDVPTMIEDIGKRPFITIGMATFIILLALAVTSNRAAIRRLGRRWQQLHRLVYLAAVGAVIHFWWLVKADITLPRRWAVTLAVLLGFRLLWMLRTRTRTGTRTRTSLQF